MSARDEESADPTDPTFPDRPSAQRKKKSDDTTDRTAADVEASLLERPTLDASEPLAAPAADVSGAVPSSELPGFETATEIDPGLAGWAEDQASAEILDAFRAAHDPTPLDAPPDATEPDIGSTPSDPHGRFERLRVPTRDEINEAIQGTPTLALEAQPAQDPPTLVDDTSPVAAPSSAELRRIVERTAIVSDPAAPRAERPDPAETNPPDPAEALGPQPGKALESSPGTEAKARKRESEAEAREDEPPFVEPAPGLIVDPASEAGSPAGGDESWDPAPASLPYDFRVPDRVFDPDPPRRTKAPTGLIVVAGILAALAAALAGLLVWRTL